MAITRLIRCLWPPAWRSGHHTKGKRGKRKRNEGNIFRARRRLSIWSFSETHLSHLRSRARKRSSYRQNKDRASVKERSESASLSASNLSSPSASIRSSMRTPPWSN